ncbi:hypothetical protein LOZ80_14915 [Paenibacillus sp. HWE-109]|uniref:phage tail assembly chaperone n=1 Tax=Paenibacillus sp. HWE-109 TaxID=1306526 RepID=UPI001EDD308C|nr:hypothetical protein [Paenibacillus sp. HWE-109]UKS30152.1 hypothetical protein LOZ80_14915 [Paenibacillus sp. HWE-109]
MDALQALLSANLEIEQDVYIKRLGVNFRIKAISTKDLEKAREQCTQVSGKGSRKESVIDTDRLNAVLAVKFCVSPDFGDKALLAKYNAANAVECVGKALLPGELAKINAAGTELSGFGDDEEAEEDVKN